MSRREDSVTLFIGNLPDDSGDREEKIRDLFSSNGIEIIAVRSNPMKRFCHVELANPSDKSKGTRLNGADFDGYSLKVDVAENKSSGGGRDRDSRDGYSSSRSDSRSDGKTIIMFGVSGLTEDDVISVTGCESANIIDNKGIGFLTFSDSTGAKALAAEGSVEIHGRSYNLEMARPRGESGGRGGGRGRGGYSRGGGYGGSSGGYGGSSGGYGGGGYGGGGYSSRDGGSRGSYSSRGSRGGGDRW